MWNGRKRIIKVIGSSRDLPLLPITASLLIPGLSLPRDECRWQFAVLSSAFLLALYFFFHRLPSGEADERGVLRLSRDPTSCPGFSLGSSPASRFCFPIPDKPLSNMKILTLGKLSRNKDEVKATVEKLGGKLTGTANKASLCISTKSELYLICKPEVILSVMRIKWGDVLNTVSHTDSATDLVL